jgi:hypothetical protein
MVPTRVRKPIEKWMHLHPPPWNKKIEISKNFSEFLYLGGIRYGESESEGILLILITGKWRKSTIVTFPLSVFHMSFAPRYLRSIIAQRHLRPYICALIIAPRHLRTRLVKYLSEKVKNFKNGQVGCACAVAHTGGGKSPGLGG